MKETLSLFGDDKPKGPLTSWGVEIDLLARANGGWPDNVVVYAMEVIDPQAPRDKAHIKFEGDVPIGVKSNGRPKYPSGKARKPRIAVCSMAEYDAAITRMQAAKAAALQTQAGGE